MFYDFLNAQYAFIWRIVHFDNLPWLIQNGLHCANTTIPSNNWLTIGNKELISKRNFKAVPLGQGGVLNDYVPFYFTPFSPMLYNIYTGYNGTTKVDNENIVILVASLHELEANQVDFVFTDKHAYIEFANFYDDLSDLDKIDWGILQRKDFQRDMNDPQKMERYQAEALIYKNLPINQLKAIVCYSEAVKTRIDDWLALYSIDLTVVVRRDWFFE